MKKTLLSLLMLLPFIGFAQTSHTIYSSNYFVFSPSTLTVDVGDTINFLLNGTHDAVEVDQSTWMANDSTPNGGFNFPVGSGGGQFIVTNTQTYYYVCRPHASMGMKGEIIVNSVVVSVQGCTDSTALNYNPLATIDDSSCAFPLVYENLFFSEYGEGSSNNRYFEIYNPTNDTISLINYAFARVNGNPTTVGVYEYWNDFDSASVVLPNDVFVVAHVNADSLILLYADMTVSGFTALSNGDDGMALVFGSQPNLPAVPSLSTYVIVDWLGDWNGDPGQGWVVSGVNAGTRNHTLIRNCNITQGDTSWNNSAANQWMVKSVDYWLDLGTHNWMTSVTDSVYFTFCNGLSVTIGNNTYDSTGVYADILTSYNGCDSIVITTLTVLTSSASIVVNNFTICDGDSVVVDSNSYFFSGTYLDTLVNSAGCDSIITTHLVVQTPTYQSFTICDGDSVLVGSLVYDTTGNYTDTIQSSVGCDSVVFTEVIVYSQFNSVFGGIPNNSVGGGGFYSGSQYLELSVLQNSELLSAVIYANDTVVTNFQLRDNNGNILDSVTTTVLPGGHRVYFNFSLVSGNNYELGIDGNSNNLYRNNSGVNYPYNLGSLASITSSSVGGNYYYFFYDIELKQSSTPTNYSICAGQSITIAGNVYDSTGLYTDSLTSSIGCDSLVFTNLVVYPSVSYTNNQTICNGETYTLNGNVYDSTGTYMDYLYTIFGCDSIVTTILIVDSIIGGSSLNNQTICLGDSVSVGANTYYTPGTYSDTLTSDNGCDSIVYTNLVVNQATTSDSTLVLNNFPSSASVAWNGLILISSGSYPVILINSAGCDSTATLHLTLNPLTGILDINNTERTLLKITNILGQKTTLRKSTPLFYIYDDGTVEKRIIIVE